MKKKIYIIYKTIIIIKPNQSLLVIINDKQTDRKTGRGKRRECIVMNVSTVVTEECWYDQSEITTFTFTKNGNVYM